MNLRTNLALACVLIFTLLMAGLIIGCTSGRFDERTQRVEGIKEMVYDGCQYLVVENSMPGGNNYSFSMTHKGNCTNVIHNHR